MGRAGEELGWVGKCLGEKNTSVELVLHERAGGAFTPGALCCRTRARERGQRHAGTAERMPICARHVIDKLGTWPRAFATP